ncbi:MAG: PKD domain-containing protein [Sphingobacteriales bacterium]|nr:MAG: PKD domain-containing protein [Sphingobacteriales bacterium]
MNKLIYYLITALLCTQFVNAQGWVSFFIPNYILGPSYTNVWDLVELENGNYLCSGLDPGLIMINSENGDTLWTSNIAAGHIVQTNDGGYIVNNTKFDSNFVLVWEIPFSAINPTGLGLIFEAVSNNEDIVYFSGRTQTILIGDAPFPYEYNCTWFLNSSTGDFQSSVRILALPVQTLDDWAAGANNDMVPLLEGNGWMVFAQCNDCHSCFIKVPNGSSISQSCIDGFNAETRSIIHSNEGDGYIVTFGNRTIAKVAVNTYFIWSNVYQTTIPPVVPGTYGFHNIISTGTDGYIAVGRTNSDEKLWVIKIDNNGNLQWQSDHIRIKNYRTVGNTIIKTSDGGYLIGGVAVHITSPLNERYPFFVKMDSTGNCRPQAAFIHSIDNYTLNIVSNTSTGAHEYTWLFGNSDTAQTATPVYTYPNPGTYNLCLVATNPCGNDTLCTQIDVATGIHKPDNPIQSITTLYPNPVSANQNIYWQADGISSGASLELRVFNLTGNILYREQPNQPSGILPSHTYRLLLSATHHPKLPNYSAVGSFGGMI